MSSHFPRRAVRAAGVVLAAALPLAAQAHAGDTGHLHGALEAVASGLSHPFTGLDHLAAMTALGAWTGLTARRSPWQAPLTFVLVLLAGALMGLSGVALPAVEPLIATSVLVLGLLLACARALPPSLAGALAAGFALFHGAAHGGELAGPAAGFALAGMVAASAVLLGAGFAGGRASAGRSLWLPRVAGAAVAAFGAALLA